MWHFPDIPGVVGEISTSRDFPRSVHPQAGMEFGVGVESGVEDELSWFDNEGTVAVVEAQAVDGDGNDDVLVFSRREFHPLISAEEPNGAAEA